MKKHSVWSGVLAFVLCSSALPLSVSAVQEQTAQTEAVEDSGAEIDTSNDATYDVFTYRENESGVTITSCDTAATEAVIPSEIDGKAVTEIGDAAFMNCTFLTALEVPAGVTKIGESAFSTCSMLCQISLPEGLTSIGSGAFEACEMLSVVNFPSTLTVLPDALFYNCSYLPSLELPDTIQEIGNETFYSCTALTSITLSENLEKIGDYAFQNCQVLTDVTIPATCTTLGIYAFDGCQGLTDITVADGNTAYMSQDGVLFTADEKTLIRYPQVREATSYQVPDGCEALEDWSFIGSTNLEQIDLNGVTSIGEDCFYYCTALQKVEVPSGVTALNGAVFAYCTEMKQAVLPDTLETIGDHCFYSCASLADITIPEGVTTLGERSFYNCIALLDLTLPASISEVGEEALGYYTPSTSTSESDVERITGLQVHNDGSSAVRVYLRGWKSGAYMGWLIAGGVVLVLAVGIVILVLVHRQRNKIRPTSRHASEKGQKAKQNHAAPKKKKKR